MLNLSYLLSTWSAHPILISFLLILNLGTFFMFGLDKIWARMDAWRARERTLLLLALLGGSPGAILGMYLFRHKTQKPAFGLLLVVILLLQIALYAFLRSGGIFSGLGVY